MNFTFDVAALVSTFPIIGMGMAGVFSVIILIWLSIVALTKIGK